MPDLYIFLIGMFVSALCGLFVLITFQEFKRLTAEQEAERD